MKYIIVEDFSGQPVPFLFPHRVDHVDMREQLPYRKILSAGFVILEDGAFRCYGESRELGVCAREDDALCIAEKFSRRENTP